MYKWAIYFSHNQRVTLKVQFLVRQIQPQTHQRFSKTSPRTSQITGVQKHDSSTVSESCFTAPKSPKRSQSENMSKHRARPNQWLKAAWEYHVKLYNLHSSAPPGDKKRSTSHVASSWVKPFEHSPSTSKQGHLSISKQRSPLSVILLGQEHFGTRLLWKWA